MGETLFNRNARVTFGQRGLEGARVTNLRIVFDIKKTKTSTGNDCKIKIYNMNSTNRDLLKNEDDMIVSLEVGYGGNFDEIYYGNIQYAIPFERVGPDIVTTIEAKTGHRNTVETQFDKSYDGGVKHKNIVKDITDKMKELGDIAYKEVASLKDTVVQNGFSLSGTVEHVMDKIMAQQELEWSIQDRKLQILEPDQTTGEDAILFTPLTGLIGSPKPREKGVEFKALIQATEMAPGRAIKLESQSVNGIFKIKELGFKGDTHGKSWFAKVVAE